MTIKEARKSVGITQRILSEQLEIPLRTIENWESGKNVPPKYVEKLIVEKILSFCEIREWKNEKNRIWENLILLSHFESGII